MKRHLLAAAALLTLATSHGALAADPSGVWLTQTGDIADPHRGLRRRPVRHHHLAAGAERHRDQEAEDRQEQLRRRKRSRPLIGVQIVLGMKPAGDGKWTGQVYNAEDGKTYSGNLTFSGGNSLQLEGCALGGLVCKKQTWTKVN
jgi:uncharacterized protein (DUF2147 family)